MHSKNKILLVEDESSLSKLVVKYLSELITFSTLPSKSKIDNKNTCNNRKRDRDPSNIFRKRINIIFK